MFITAVCVIFLIKLRWPKNKSLYDTIKPRLHAQHNRSIIEATEKFPGGEGIWSPEMVL